MLKILYPNIDSEMYSIYEKLSFECPSQRDALKLTLEEFGCYARPGLKGTILDREYYTTYREAPDEKLKLSSILYSTTYTNWGSDLSKRLASYLKTTPQFLPYFIQNNVIGIIKEFFCLPYQNDDYYVRCPNTIDTKPRSSYINEYETAIWRAAKCLKILIEISSELLDLNVNLGELQFRRFEQHTTYASMDSLPFWNEDISSIFRNGYRRIDGVDFSQDQMTKYFSFTDMNGFLESVISLSKTLTVMKDVSICVDDVVSSCKYLQEKLNKKMEETLIKMVDESIDELVVLCDAYKEDDRMYQSLVDMLNEIRRKMYDLISRNKAVHNCSNDKIKDILLILSTVLDRVNSYSEENVLSAKTAQTLFGSLLRRINSVGRKVKDISIDDLFTQADDSNLTEIRVELSQLHQRVDNLEARINTIEDMVVSIIQTGAYPKDFDTISKKARNEIIRIAYHFKPKDSQEKKRRRDLLRRVKAGALSIVLACTLRSSRSEEISYEIQTPNFRERSVISEMVPKISAIPRFQKDSLVSLGENSLEDDSDSLVPEESTDELTSYEYRLIEELAIEVIRGDWGNFPERKELLEAAGYDYKTVQAFVNKMMAGEAIPQDFYDISNSEKIIGN